jgi:hypothetical protein
MRLYMLSQKVVARRKRNDVKPWAEPRLSSDKSDNNEYNHAHRRNHANGMARYEFTTFTGSIRARDSRMVSNKPYWKENKENRKNQVQIGSAGTKKAKNRVETAFFVHNSRPGARTTMPLRGTVDRFAANNPPNLIEICT